MNAFTIQGCRDVMIHKGIPMFEDIYKSPQVHCSQGVPIQRIQI